MNKKKTIIRATKKSKYAKLEANDRAHNKIMKKAGTHSCPVCGPWRDDNAVAHIPKRSPKKPKYKNKR